MEDDAIDAASVPSEGKHAPPKGKVQGGSFARVPIAALVDRSLNDGDVRTLGGICAYMRKDDYAWPSQLLLGMATGRSRCAANRSVKKLESRVTSRSTVTAIVTAASDAPTKSTSSQRRSPGFQRGE